MNKYEALSQLCDLETSIKASQERAASLRAIIDAPEPPKQWTPKKPTLCWVSESNQEPMRLKIIEAMTSTGEYKGADGIWRYAAPLTRTEALFMVDNRSRYGDLWDRAPKSSRFMTTDKWLGIWAHEHRPSPREYCWDAPTGRKILLARAGFCPDWRDTLEERP